MGGSIYQMRYKFLIWSVETLGKIVDDEIARWPADLRAARTGAADARATGTAARESAASVRTAAMDARANASAVRDSAKAIRETVQAVRPGRGG